jgi:hypothetical protein
MSLWGLWSYFEKLLTRPLSVSIRPCPGSGEKGELGLEVGALYGEKEKEKGGSSKRLEMIKLGASVFAKPPPLPAVKKRCQEAKFFSLGYVLLLLPSGA